jgi:arylsulfatase A-like enzyme
MTRSKRTVMIGVACGLLAGITGGFYLRPKQTAPQKQPNIVILSFCSLRKAELDGKITPNLNRVFDHAFVFKNAFSRYGWTNPSLYLFNELAPRMFVESGYDMIGTEGQGLLFRIPSDAVSIGDRIAPPDQFVNDFQLAMAYLRSKIEQPRLKPFFAYVHVKYMHYPYIDRLNPGMAWAKFLSSEEKSRVEKLLSDKKSHNSLPLKLILTGDPAYLGGQKGTRFDFNSIYPTFSDPKIMSAWKAEPQFSSDLEIIRKVYRAKLADWDSNFKDLFELFGHKDIADNTILIITGDHGEAFMEHGSLGHANNTYDEVITFPLAVKFPGQKNEVEVDSQFFQGTFVDLVRGLVDGSVTQDTFQSKIIDLEKNKMIISRNCANTSHSVRMDNKWKYIEDSGQPARLYDLQNDPKELKNVSADHPDLTAKLKFYLIDHADEFAKVVDISPCRDL